MGSDLGGILLIGINQVGAEGAIGLPSLKNLLGFISYSGGVRRQDGVPPKGSYGKERVRKEECIEARKTETT